MVVELAKVSLWLHTFTAGAPLSFSRSPPAVRRFAHRPARQGGHRRVEPTRAGCSPPSAIAGARSRHREACNASRTCLTRMWPRWRKSASLFGQVEETTADLRGLLDFLGGLRYLTAGMKKREHATYEGPLVTTLGRQPDNAYALLSRGPNHAGDRASDIGDAAWLSFSELWREAKAIAHRERFLHWEAAFPRRVAALAKPASPRRLRRG